MSKSKTVEQRNKWHVDMEELAKLIGEKVEDYKDPSTGKMVEGLKTVIKKRANLFWGEDLERMEMLFQGMIAAAETMQKSIPNITPCEFLTLVRPKVIKAKVQRRRSEEYTIDEYSAVIGETHNMYYENGYTPPNEPPMKGSQDD